MPSRTPSTHHLPRRHDDDDHVHDRRFAHLTLDPRRRRYRERTPRSLELLERTRADPDRPRRRDVVPAPLPPSCSSVVRACWIWDVDGNRYLDLRIGDWVMIHGHSKPVIRGADRRTARQGDPFPGRRLGPELPDGDAAARRMPSLERIRFLVSGTEANLLAIRLAGRTQGGSRSLGPRLPRPPRRARDRFDRGRDRPSRASRRLAAHDHRARPRSFNDPDGAERSSPRGADVAAVLLEPVQGGGGMIDADPSTCAACGVTERLGSSLSSTRSSPSRSRTAAPRPGSASPGPAT
jgi:glutamate-1-semialdehyde 2,1-aminomutase